MLQITSRTLLSATVLTAASIAGSSATAANLITSGNINIASNWDTGVLPGAGETANVNIDASWPGTSNAGELAIEGDLIFGGGSTLTAAIDVVGSNPNSVTFNNVTVNVGDDIFTGGAGGNFIFNAGSVTNVNDDFEANAGGTITVNGGTHTANIASPNTGLFGAQNGSTLNLTGGNISAGGFRVAATGNWTLGGSAVLAGGGDAALLEGAVAVASDWDGSWTITGLSGTDWEAEVTGGDYTLDGNVVDGTIFANSFVVTDNGQTLSLSNPVPEPSSLALLGLGGLLIARRRRG